MQVETVGGARRHHVDPAIGHVDLAAFEVKIERFGIGPHVFGEFSFKTFESRREAMQLIH